MPICNELITSAALLDNIARSLLGLPENETSLMLTLNKNVPGAAPERPAAERVAWRCVVPVWPRAREDGLRP